MTTAAIRKKLMAYIADADEKKVKGLYMLVEDDMANVEDFKLSAAHMKIVEEEQEKYQKGEGKSYNWEEAKQIIRTKSKKA